MCDLDFFPNVTAENHPPTKGNFLFEKKLSYCATIPKNNPLFEQ